jgi:pantetheine-phosphate adenylyltransferase
MTDRRIGIYPGTFDPVTNGHMDVVLRAVRIVDRLVIGVATNDGKGPMFSVDERVLMLREEIAAQADADLAARITVKPFAILLMNFAVAENAGIIIRGLRAVSDFEYEFQMAGMNARLNPAVETVFLMASEGVQFISSRFVKEIGRLGGDISHFVPPRVVDRLAARLAAGRAG